MKTCTKCNKELTESNFYKHKAYAGGLRPTCKKCDKDYQMRWNAENMDKRRRYVKRWESKRTLEEIESSRRYKKEYYEKNKGKLRIKRKRKKSKRVAVEVTATQSTWLNKQGNMSQAIRNLIDEAIEKQR